jgi:hypothetical protein
LRRERKCFREAEGQGRVAKGEGKGRAPAAADAPKSGCSPIRLVLGTAAEEVEDDSGGDPIVVLVKAGTEGSPVVVDVD